MNNSRQNAVGQTVPADTALGVPFPVPGERNIVQAAEAEVASEWKAGDVILDL